ncbi:MAG: NUDIX domain-containing protein, partial [Alphaproteobacteria bacterium]
LTVSHSYKEGRSLPGGGLRRGEPPDRGAARELREETGVCIDPADLNLVDIVETDGRYGRRISWIYVIGLSSLPRLRCNGWETVSAQLSEPSGVPLPRSVSLPPPRAVA